MAHQHLNELKSAPMESKAVRTIITAEKFGSNEVHNKLVAESIQKKLVSSASLLANFPGSDAAVELIKQHNISAGIELNVTEGRPLSDATSVSSLLTEEGVFHGETAFRAALESKKIDLKQVETELKAQIKWFTQKTDVKGAFAAAHHHVHVFPDIAPIVARLLREANITYVQLPLLIESDVASHPTAKAISDYAKSVKSVYSGAGISTNDVSVGIGKVDAVNFQNALKEIASKASKKDIATITIRSFIEEKDEGRHGSASDSEKSVLDFDGIKGVSVDGVQVVSWNEITSSA